MDDLVLSGILQNCVALENFSLIKSTGFTKLIIMNSNFKVLRLQALYVDRLEVNAHNNFEYRLYAFLQVLPVNLMDSIRLKFSSATQFCRIPLNTRSSKCNLSSLRILRL
jgi:SPX domain protein involved in polyphosphate accumulation